MAFTHIPFQRVDTEEFGRITTEVHNPTYDGKGNYATGQIKLHDHLWPVTITQEWEEDRRVWRQVVTDEYKNYVKDVKQQPPAVQKYPDGSTVHVDGHEWTVELLCRDEDTLLPSQTDRGEDFNLYRLSRHNTKSILRWQHEIDASEKMASLLRKQLLHGKDIPMTEEIRLPGGLDGKEGTRQ